ncbi:MAG: hypothetical protein JF597_09810 [Streptomyces sp.]|uniref:hypothetical protein n=1 Tax=Streptomyces sp. TaxID=1931 RepID=UPI0025FAED82|nr:hypothetical protein [Streptomyces sp.]MBW8793867.1 hypothetical protein [Streptomyces sp.]
MKRPGPLLTLLAGLLLGLLTLALDATAGTRNAQGLGAPPGHGTVTVDGQRVTADPVLP